MQPAYALEFGKSVLQHTDQPPGVPWRKQLKTRETLTFIGFAISNGEQETSQTRKPHWRFPHMLRILSGVAAVYSPWVCFVLGAVMNILVVLMLDACDDDPF